MFDFVLTILSYKYGIKKTKRIILYLIKNINRIIQNGKMKIKEVSKVTKHFMILSSSYSAGKRIAMHYVIDGQMNPEMLIGEVKKIKELCGETVSISTHYVETDSADLGISYGKRCFF